MERIEGGAVAPRSCVSVEQAVCHTTKHAQLGACSCSVWRTGAPRPGSWFMSLIWPSRRFGVPCYGAAAMVQLHGAYIHEPLGWGQIERMR